MDTAETPMTGPLAAIGVDTVSEQVYRLCLRRPGLTLEHLSDVTSRSVADLELELEPLKERRLIAIRNDSIFAEPPELALGRLLTLETRRLAEAEDALSQARDEVHSYIAEHLVGQRTDWQPVAVDVIPTDELADVMLTLVGNSSGDLLFLRPDQWSLPTGVPMDQVVKKAMHAGRVSRVIYPAIVTESRPENIHARGRAGEQIRVLPDLPTRMAVFGSDAAVMPELWGSPAGSRLLIRQPAIVAMCVTLFDELWSRAVKVPGLGAELGDGARSQLLELLASGAKDEQIARRLSMSLRTVRRRVASLLAELGVDSRFQAGMEAVRRGWL